MAILLCFDGSDQSKHAVGVTGELFAGAQTHVLNVWEPVERIVARYAVLAPYMGEELGAADDSAQDAAAAHTAKLVTTVWEAVLEVAQVLDVDVIITGTRSLHGVREMVSNTLSHALIQHSPRAVLAIPTPVS